MNSTISTPSVIGIDIAKHSFEVCLLPDGTQRGFDYDEDGLGRLQQLLPNGVIVWINGLDRTQWNGIPLPLTVPTSTGAPSGTCTLYTDPFFLTATT